MEAVIFIGIQAAGKSTFYKERFFKTHVRISLDMLKTRAKEKLLLEACIKAKLPFVVDNTNPTVEDRKRYADILKETGYKMTAYYFETSIGEAIARNEKRSGKEKVPLAAIRMTYAKLQPPGVDEELDSIYTVKCDDNGGFLVKEYKNRA